EFALRDSTHAIVAGAYAEHLEKKVATSAPVATVLTAATPPASTPTARKRSKRSAGRGPAPRPITTVGPLVIALRRGTSASASASPDCLRRSSDSAPCAAPSPTASTRGRSCCGKRREFA